MNVVETITDFLTIHAARTTDVLSWAFLVSAPMLMVVWVLLISVMKSNVYESKFFRDQFSEWDKSGYKRIYAPLRRLSRAMSHGVLSCLVATASQAAIGSINNWVTAVICLGLAAFAFGNIVRICFLIEANLMAMAWLSEAEANRLEGYGPLPSMFNGDEK